MSHDRDIGDLLAVNRATIDQADAWLRDCRNLRRRTMTDEPRHDQTTDEEALGREEMSDGLNPNVGEGTPTTAPERPVPETLLEKTRRLLRRT